MNLKKSGKTKYSGSWLRVQTSGVLFLSILRGNNQMRRRRFFIGRTHFCTTNLRIWYFFGQETYTRFVAQEISIIRKLFIFSFVQKQN